MKYSYLLPVFLISTLFATDVKVVELEHTSFNKDMKVEFHTNNEVLSRNNPIFFRLKSFPLGVNTYSEKLMGMRQNPHGTSIVMFFNGGERIYLRKIDASVAEKNRNYEKDYRKYLPSKIAKELHEGKNVVTIAALNSYGESIKHAGGISTRIVDYGKRVPRNQSLEEKLNKPYVLYNEPTGKFLKGEPVLLDFISQNVSLSPKGNKIIVRIDGIDVAHIVKNVPHKILNLPRGRHLVKLILVNNAGHPYQLPFDVQESVITVD